MKITYFLSFLFLLLVLPISVSGNTYIDLERIQGEDRFQTAIEISKEGWDQADTVILATSTNFPDALAGTPLAAKHDAPILLTGQNQINDETLDRILELQAEEVILLGGNQVIPESIEDQLSDKGIEQITRIGGADRFETAQLIADELDADHAFIVSGTNFPDALSIAPYAAQEGSPILLTLQDQLPKDTESAMGNYSSSTVIGGEVAISDEVVDSLSQAERLYGENRFDTSAVIAKTYYPDATEAFAATGMDFPDALTGSAAASKLDSPVLLTHTDHTPQDILDYLSSSNIRSISVLGGQVAINDASFESLRNNGLIEGKVSAINSDAFEVFLLVNEARIERDIAPLTFHTGISKVAEEKSRDMNENDYFAHESPTYGSPTDMLAEFGYPYAGGENLAMGYYSPEAVFEAWMDSAGHKSNILNGSYTHIGVGKDGTYWTQLFTIQ